MRTRAWSSERTVEFGRFVVTGGMAAAVALGMLYVLVDLVGINYLVAYLMTFVLVNGGAFFASRRLAFAGSPVRSGPGLLRFYLVSAISVAANAAALALAVEVLGTQYLLAAVVLMLLNAPINYFVHRRFTFRLAMRQEA